MCIVLPETVPPEYVNEKRLLSVTAFFFVRSIDGFDQSVDHDVEIALGTVPFETDQTMYRTGECFVTMDQHLFDQRLFVQGYFLRRQASKISRRMTLSVAPHSMGEV